jgi:hypothetical protein
MFLQRAATKRRCSQPSARATEIATHHKTHRFSKLSNFKPKQTAASRIVAADR